MNKVNQLNWQYSTIHINLSKGSRKRKPIERPVADFESIMIGQEMDTIVKNKLAIKVLILPMVGFKVNLYSSVVTLENGQVALLKK